MHGRGGFINTLPRTEPVGYQGTPHSIAALTLPMRGSGLVDLIFPQRLVGIKMKKRKHKPKKTVGEGRNRTLRVRIEPLRAEHMQLLGSPRVTLNLLNTEQLLQIVSSKVPQVRLERLDAGQWPRQKRKLTRYEVRMFMLHHFDLGETVSETVAIMNEGYGPVVTEKTCRRWFLRFQKSRSCVDLPRKGRPRVSIDTNKLFDDIASNSRLTIRAISEKYGCSAATMMRAIRDLLPLDRCESEDFQ